MGCPTCFDISRGKSGSRGVSSYLYFAYAEAADGTGFSLIPDATRPFLSWAIKPLPDLSLTLGDFFVPFLRFLGTPGADGVFGGISFEYLISQSLVNADPGTGKIRLNDSNLDTATQMYISLLTFNAADISAMLTLCGASTNAVKSLIKIVDIKDSSKFVCYTVTGVSIASYGTFTIQYVAGQTTQFPNLQDAILTISLVGDKGDTGTPGTSGTTVLVYGEGADSGDTGGGDTIFGAYTVPANTLANDGDLLDIDIIVENKDAAVVNPFTGNIEESELQIVHSAGTITISSPNFQADGEQHRFKIGVQRNSVSTSGMSGFIYYGNTHYNDYLNSVNIDFTQPITVNIVARNFIQSSQSNYQMLRKFYICYIPKV